MITWRRLKNHEIVEYGDVFANFDITVSHKKALQLVKRYKAGKVGGETFETAFSITTVGKTVEEVLQIPYRLGNKYKYGFRLTWVEEESTPAHRERKIQMEL